MKQQEFMEKLLEELLVLSKTDREHVTEYYNEMFSDGIEIGREEESIIAGFGNPKEIAEKIKKEYQQCNQMVHTRPAVNEKSGFTSTEPVHSIIVEAQNIHIDVRPVTTGIVCVKFQPKEGLDEITFSSQGGEFVFRHHMRNLFFWLNWFRLTQRITVEVPVDFNGNILIKSSNAPVTIAGLNQLSNSQFISSNAHLSVDNVHSKSLLIQTSNGGLTLNNLLGDQMEAVTCNGRISAFNCHFVNALLLSTKNCPLDGRNLKSDKIVLKTSNGPLTGTIIGDIREYAVQSRTTNASNNLPDYSFPGQTKHLLAKTSNGRIKVNFEL